MDVPRALEYLVGLQAQAPRPPYIALWSRLEGFDPDELGRMLLERRAVRMALMRSTIHLVTTPDAVYLRPLTQTAVEKGFAGYRRYLEGVDLDKVADAGRILVERTPLTFADIGTALGRRWRSREPRALAHAVRALVPLVQVTPRGVWGAGGPAAHTTLKAWTGRDIRRRADPRDLLLRYFRAFGPASVADAQTWSGLTRLREPVASLGSKLRIFRDEQGRELFDVPDGHLPDEDRPAPVRFLGEFDNALLSHADRGRIMSDDHRKRVAQRAGMVPGAVLVDGFFAGVWRLERRGSQRVLVIEPYRRLLKREQGEVTEEAESLFSFLAPGLDPAIEVLNA